MITLGVAWQFYKGITLMEFITACVLSALVAVGAVLIVSNMNVYDVEVLNSTVKSKSRDWTMCSHSYSCNCRTTCSGSGSKRTCSTTCDTCHEHFNDYDWNVYTADGNVITIDRVDRQGVSEPARFRSVVIGEPTSITHGYDNYVKASPGSLFRHQGIAEKYASSLPKYPQNVYDYYRLNRIVTSGVTLGDKDLWNSDLSAMNARLGAKKQVNMIVVLTRDKPIEWFSALEQSWIGGKKNDVVLVVSLDAQMKQQWAQVMAWTSNEYFKVKLRDDIMRLESFDRTSVMRTLELDVNAHFVRKPMKEFEYLKSSITPTPMQWIITLIIAIALSVGVSVYFHNQDVFNEAVHRMAHRLNYY